MANMSAEEFLEKIEQLTGNRSTFDPKNVEDFQKSIKAFSEHLKRQQPALSRFQNFLDGTKQPIENVVKEMDELNRAIKAAKQARNSERVDELESTKAEIKKTVVTKNVTAGLSNMASGIGAMAQTLYEGTRDFAKSLQSGASGIEAATRASLKAIEASAGVVKMFSGMAQSVGMVVALMGPWGRAIGLVITGLGMLGEWLAGKSAEKVKDGVEFLGDELKKTEKGFKDITSTGAIFAGGMTEMRQEAARAGLDIAQLADVVKRSREDLMNMGLGLGEATRRIGGVSKELRNSQLGIQLRNLGYSAEEQAELAAQVMARQNAAGDRRALTDRQIAEITAQYGKELRILSDITGQDAKKAMEKARAEALEVDVLAKATREGGAEGFKKMQTILATMPEVYKKGFMEMYSAGASTDLAFRVGLDRNPELRKQISEQLNIVRDQNLSAEDAGRRTAELSEKSLKYARDNLTAYENIGRAARLSKDAVLTDIVRFRNAEITEQTKRADGASRLARMNADLAADNQRPLDVAVQGLEENTQKLRSALGESLLTPLTNFAQTLATGVDTVDKALEKMGLGKAKPTTPTTGTTFGNTGGGAATGGARIGRRGTGTVAPTGGTVLSKDLKIKGGPEGQATAGGPVTDKLASVANAVHNMLKGDYKYFSGFNDLSRVGSPSKHAEGQAFDLVLNEPAQYGKVKSMIEKLPGVKLVLDESRAPADPTQKDKWGPHLHTEVHAKEGGTFSGPDSGYPATLHGDEAVVPLPDGRNIPVKMDVTELVSKLEELISVAKDHRDTSEKILSASV